MKNTNDNGGIPTTAQLDALRRIGFNGEAMKMVNSRDAARTATKNIEQVEVATRTMSNR